MKPFDIIDAGLGDLPGVTLRGEIDISAVDELDTALDSRIRATTGTFVADLCDVTFLDSSGLATLVRARALLETEDRQMVIVCQPGAARRIFELTGTIELFVMYESREQAAAALVPAD